MVAGRTNNYKIAKAKEPEVECLREERTFSQTVYILILFLQELSPVAIST